MREPEERARGTSRTVAALLAATLGLVASPFPAVASSDGCDEAQARFAAEWDASGHAPSAKVARAARDVIEACPQDDDAWTWTQSADLPVVKIRMDAQGLLAMRCGFKDKTSGTYPDALIVGSMQYLGTTRSERDRGPATITYDPSSNLTEYTVTGTNWTLSASNANLGYIIAHGVLYPIASNGATQAGGGCGALPSPTLCWGYGYGTARIGTIAVSASSEFQNC